MSGAQTSGLPIFSGVIGHRDLREQDVPALRKLVTVELNMLMERNTLSLLTPRMHDFRVYASGSFLV